MKRTVTTTERETIRLEDVSNLSHIGYVMNSGNKGYIVAIDEDQFTAVLTEEGRMHCNKYNEVIKATQKDKIDELLANAPIKIYYAFSNRKELYQWLASDEN